MSERQPPGPIARVLRRPRARAALAVLALLYASAVYAPLIANDRPYLLVAIDYGGYQAALGGLGPVMASLDGLIEEGPEAWRQRRPVDSTRTYAQALQAEQQALALRVRTLRRYLPEDRPEVLGELQAAFRGAVEDQLAGEGEDARALAGRARELVQVAQTELTARDPRRPGQGQFDLRAAHSRPLLDSLSDLEVFFMLFGLLAPLALAAGLRRAGQGVGAPLVFALLLSATLVQFRGFVPDSSPAFDVGLEKRQLASGSLVAERVVFAPIAMGYAETHLGEVFRPPTWLAASEMDEAGHYLRGGRTRAAVASPVQVRPGEPALNAPTRHLLGTDSLGRDLAARLIWGGRISLSVGLASALLLVVLGILVGAVAGTSGGTTDLVLGRVIETVQCFPSFFLILTAAALIPERTLHPALSIVLLIAAVGWTGVARLVRGECLRLRELDFVAAARALGFTPARTILRHVVPNALGPVSVAGAFAVGSGILIESAVSFLGFGVRHPVPSWGAVINETRVAEYWWVQLFCGLAIFVTVLAYNVVGEELREELDPPGAPVSGPLLEVRGLRVSFPGPKGELVHAVDGLDLELEAGETLALVGESGSGKSLTLLAVLGLVPPPGVVSAELLRFDGRDLAALSPSARRALGGRSIGMVFQEPATALNPVLNVGEQVAEVLRTHLGLERRAARTRTIELFERVGLGAPAERYGDFPHQLSGGQRQRVVIAAAIAAGPRLLFADEPTSALDVTVQAQVLELLAKLSRDDGLGLLLVSHDLALVAERADRVAVVYSGRVVERVPAAELLRRQAHPYTHLLARCHPLVVPPGESLRALPGRAPDPARRPSGCRFRDRCPIARERCAELEPSLAGPDGDHAAACHFPHEMGEHASQEAPR